MRLSRAQASQVHNEGVAIEAKNLTTELTRRIRGEVRFDRGSRALYATDASNYRQVPLGVVVPRDVDDVIETIAVCRQLGAAVVDFSDFSAAGQPWRSHLGFTLGDARATPVPVAAARNRPLRVRERRMVDQRNRRRRGECQ